MSWSTKKKPMPVYTHLMQQSLDKKFASLQAQLQLINQLQDAFKASPTPDITRTIMEAKQSVSELISQLAARDVSLSDLYQRFGSLLFHSSVIEADDRIKEHSKKNQNDDGEIVDLLDEDALIRKRVAPYQAPAPAYSEEDKRRDQKRIYAAEPELEQIIDNIDPKMSEKGQLDAYEKSVRNALADDVQRQMYAQELNAAGIDSVSAYKKSIQSFINESKDPRVLALKNKNLVRKLIQGKQFKRPDVEEGEEEARAEAKRERDGIAEERRRRRLLNSRSQAEVNKEGDQAANLVLRESKLLVELQNIREEQKREEERLTLLNLEKESPEAQVKALKKLLHEQKEAAKTAQQRATDLVKKEKAKAVKAAKEEEKGPKVEKAKAVKGAPKGRKKVVEEKKEEIREEEQTMQGEEEEEEFHRISYMEQINAVVELPDDKVREMLDQFNLSAEAEADGKWRVKKIKGQDLVETVKNINNKILAEGEVDIDTMLTLLKTDYLILQSDKKKSAEKSMEQTIVDVALKLLEQQGEKEDSEEYIRVFNMKPPEMLSYVIAQTSIPKLKKQGSSTSADPSTTSTAATGMIQTGKEE